MQLDKYPIFLLIDLDTWLSGDLGIRDGKSGNLDIRNRKLGDQEFFVPDFRIANPGSPDIRISSPGLPGHRIIKTIAIFFALIFLWTRNITK